MAKSFCILTGSKVVISLGKTVVLGTCLFANLTGLHWGCGFMIIAVLNWDLFSNIWCRNAHRMCPPFLQEQRIFDGSVLQKKAFSKKFRNYQKLTHRNPCLPKEKWIFLYSFFRQDWPQYSGGFSFMLLGLQIWCRNNLPPAYANGRIVAARRAACRNRTLCFLNLGIDNRLSVRYTIDGNRFEWVPLEGIGLID